MKRPEDRLGEPDPDRAQRCAGLVATGLTNRQQVADQMFISTHTVAFHLRQVFRKLQHPVPRRASACCPGTRPGQHCRRAVARPAPRPLPAGAPQAPTRGAAPPAALAALPVRRRVAPASYSGEDSHSRADTELAEGLLLQVERDGVRARHTSGPRPGGWSTPPRPGWRSSARFPSGFPSPWLDGRRRPGAVALRRACAAGAGSWRGRAPASLAWPYPAEAASSRYADGAIRIVHGDQHVVPRSSAADARAHGSR